ncbi:MAG: hypothetical protein HQK49_06905 [Oligoflexia bacterium]|nr:hypothetical protein [Oligoflexia bacterium]
MSIDSVKKIVNRAIKDEAFKKKLLSSPESILKEYDLSDDEISRFKNIKAETISCYKKNLDKRFVKDGSYTVGTQKEDDWWVESVSD